ncbi:MAG: hypothetical protein OXC37_04400, partial [Bdellovibrionaceae bacterium]|nr:hypothetical protein [Pseudobdellovibrionaceae bacterium]
MKIAFLFLLSFPSITLGFSETELESLENSGTKRFSESPWRSNIGFSLIRNLELETRHKSIYEEEEEEEKSNISPFHKFCDTKKEGS